MAHRIARVMAGAMANRMAKPMRFGWQNYAPNPNPNPKTQISSRSGFFLDGSDQIQVTVSRARRLGFGVDR